MPDDWKTLRVPADKYQEAKQQKEDDGRTWGEQIVRPDGEDDDLEQIVRRAVRKELDRDE